MFKALPALVALLLLVCGYTPALAQAIIGETTVLTQPDNGNANLLLTQNATLTKQAVLNSISFYVTNASGNVRLGVYDATGPSGGPGTLKAQTASFAAVKGWNTKLTTTQPTLNPGTYWLAFLPSSNGLSFVKGQGYGSIVNSAGTWTFGGVTGPSGNQIFLNGSFSTGYGNLLLSYNNQTYTLTNNAGWWQWNGSVWVQISGDPRSGTNGGTTITNTPMTIEYQSFAFGSLPTTFPASPIPDSSHWSLYASLTPTAVAGSITGESLSGTSTPGGASAPATIGTVAVTMSSGSFTGTLSLSDNTNFQLSGSTLQTKIPLTVGSTYPLTVTATQAGAGGSPFSKAFTITATGITGVSLTNTQFVGGSPSGTAVGQIQVAEVGGTFGGTFGLTGADAASFSIAGGWLYTSGTVAAGTYNIIITATQGGVGGSPKAQAFVITGTSSGSQQWLFLTGNQTFSPTAHGLIAGTAVTLEAIGSGSGGSSAVSNGGGCGGAYAHQLGSSYALTSTDVSNGMAVVVGAAGAVGSAGHTSSVADGNGALLASAGGGGGGDFCPGGVVVVGTGYSGGGPGSGAPGSGGGGGAGSGGPHGAGGAGGDGASGGIAGGGGGGAADGLGSALATGATANGGKGGGASGGAGGVGNTTPTNGAAGTTGSGGGGGGATTSGSANAGNGGPGGLVCGIWDSTHCLGGGSGGGGSASSPGHGGNGGAPAGYGCGGAAFGDSNPSLTTQGLGSAGCPGLVVVGWTGSPPVQSISSITLTGNSYTVGAVANTVIGTIAVGMTPTSPPFNYPTSTISVSDSTHFKVVNVGGVPTLEANATLSASSYTTTITATQSGATGSPFTSGTQTIMGRSLSITATPAAPSISSASPGGTPVATLQGVWSDASPFTGTYGFTAPNNNDGNTFSIVPGTGSSGQLQVNPSGPGVGFDGNTVQNVTVTAIQ